MTHSIEWHFARVKAIRHEAPRVKSFVIATPWLQQFRPGQHVDIRLTAPDGYQVQRSYSIASEPERSGEIELTVELLTDGEVSPYFHEVVQAEDEFEVRGPIGGPFTWTNRDAGPLLLLGGGSGVVPLMSMLRHRRATQSDVAAALLYSSRTLVDIIYRQELNTMAQEDESFLFRPTLTRGAPEAWTGYSRRVDVAMVTDVIEQLGNPAGVFVCGSSGFVEAATNALIEADVDPGIIATERFGPTGF